MLHSRLHSCLSSFNVMPTPLFPLPAINYNIFDSLCCKTNSEASLQWTACPVIHRTQHKNTLRLNLFKAHRRTIRQTVLFCNVRSICQRGEGREERASIKGVTGFVSCPPSIFMLSKTSNKSLGMSKIKISKHTLPLSQACLEGDR